MNLVAHWKHIDKSQMDAISRMLSHGDRLKEIARNLGMHPTALLREIRRNRAKTKPGDGDRVTFESMVNDGIRINFEDFYRNMWLARRGRR